MQRVDLKKVVRLSVQVRTVGVAIGVKEQGGVEEVVTREIEIECLPLAVPDRIEIDISEMKIGSAVRVRDLPPNENYRYLTPPDRVLVHVVTPRVAEEPVVAEAAAPAEPEVIEKGKAEEKKEETKGEKGEKGE
jgi:large subunit ribosomal protein L25